MRTIFYDPPEIEYLDGHPHPKVSPKSSHTSVQKAMIQILHERGKGRGFAGQEWRLDPGQIDRTPTEIEGHAQDGVRTFRRGEHFSHAAAPWLEFDVDEVFAELDEYKSLWKR